jgi:Tho complex subunit 7
LLLTSQPNHAEENHAELRKQIEELKVALEHAQMLRKRKIEYDQVTERVNVLPPREELEQWVSYRLYQDHSLNQGQ